MKCLEDDGVIRSVGILLMKQDGAYAGIKDFLYVIFFKHGFTVDYHLVAVNRHNLAGILVDEILHPRAQHTGGKFTSKSLFEVGFGNPEFLCKVENLNDVFIAFKPDRTEKRSYGKLLLAVDIGIHHVVDVGGELNPRPTERNDTSRIKLGTISMGTLPEEHAGRTVKLRHHDTFRTIDNESTLLGHVGNRAEIHILYDGCEILMVGISAIELQLCLEGHTVSLTTLQTLFYGVTRRVDIIIEEFKHKVVSSVCNREVFCKHLVESLVVPLLGWSVELQEVLERLQLHLKEIGIR